MKNADKLLCMELVVHTADISNPVKTWEVGREWTERVMQEFWDQVFIYTFLWLIRPTSDV
jgi:hypothetical protein